MSEPRLNFVQCLSAAGLHRMAYWEWGAPDNPRVLVCVHGLTRQGRDFDTLARAFSHQYRVVCPDVVGRGRSDWLSNPMGYQIPAYVPDMVTLIARLGVEQVDWVGTSMGGLIGLALAGLNGSPIKRLVLNDVGPTIQPAFLLRLGSYLGLPLRFGSVEEGAAYLRSISQGFGPHSDEVWLALSRPMFKPDGGQFILHYDPRIGLPLAGTTLEMLAAAEAMTWQLYDAIRCPTLLLRGTASDLLSPLTAQQMMQRGPRAQLHEFAGIGHAPTLVSQDQINVLLEFFGVT